MSTVKYPSQSAQLTSFYQAYREWLAIGSPEGKPFWRLYGLCESAAVYTGYQSIRSELRSQFESADLDGNYPFNKSPKDFFNEDRCDQNPARIAWVMDHV